MPRIFDNIQDELVPALRATLDVVSRLATASEEIGAGTQET